MCQSNFGGQVTSSSSLSSKQHSHNIHTCCSWEKWEKKTHQSGQLLRRKKKNKTKPKQSKIKIRYYLEICPVLGQKCSSSVCSQLALNLGVQGKVALPALPNVRQWGGPGTALGADNMCRLRHVCSLPTPRPASLGFL